MDTLKVNKNKNENVSLKQKVPRNDGILQTTQHHMPDDSTFTPTCRENLKSHDTDKLS
jgi:N-methylhydantoinase B/oxoprolinase/acetone carboxylase alpha subunit